MRWINRNRNKFLKRYLDPVIKISLIVMLIELFIYYIYTDLFYSILNLIIIVVILIRSFYAWVGWAKFNIQSIIINEESNSISLTYFHYDIYKETTCDVKNIKIELRYRYQSKGFLSIYCNDILIGNQESYFWKSDLDIQELYKELKKYLPEGRVVTI